MAKLAGFSGNANVKEGGKAVSHLRKQGKVVVPKTPEHASQVLRQFGEENLTGKVLLLNMYREFARIKNQALKQIAQLEKKNSERFTALNQFSIKNRTRFARGKTITLPAGITYWRSLGDELKFTKPEDDIRAHIENVNLTDLFIITKKKVSKAALRKYRKEAAGIPGVEFTKRGERFYVRPHQLHTGVSDSKIKVTKAEIAEVTKTAV